MVKSKSDLLIICGERSGDLHGSIIVKKLLSGNPKLKIHCWGGDLMKKSGAIVLEDYRNYSTMGFVEVFSRLNFFYKKLQYCKKHIIEYRPKVVLLIDFPGFNLRLAKFAKKKGFKVHYLIPPKAWAWNQSRANTLAKFVDRIYSILPFEVEFFNKFNCNISYVGNPLIKHINVLKNKDDNFKKTISLLPGSRESELKYSIPIFKEIISELKSFKFLVCGVSNIKKEVYSDFKKFENVTLYFDRTYETVSSSDVAVVMSGTASLEVSLLKVPQVVVYKTSYLSYLIGRLLIQTKYISLVNLILDKDVVTELIQGDFNKERVISEIDMLYQKNKRIEISEKYNELRNIIGNKIPENEVCEMLVKDL